jgi:hypothetical protein
MVRSLHAAQPKPRNVLPSRPQDCCRKVCPPGPQGEGGDDIERQNGKDVIRIRPKQTFPFPYLQLKCGRKKGL